MGLGEKPFFKKAAVVGVGLIGGSMAMSMRDAGLVGSVVGVGRGRENLEIALARGIVDSYTHDLSEGVAGADFVVFAVPVLRTAPLMREAAEHLSKGAVVTDVGSVKGAIVKEAGPAMPKGVHFVGGHPIAGTEHSGAEAAFSGLFRGRKCILTPTDDTDPVALATVRAVWEAAGSEVVVMEPDLHDLILAAVSHLPHVIAYSLVNTVAGVETGAGYGDVLSFSAGGFRDFTRIASSSPEMWRHIAEMNGAPLVEMIGRFEETLKGLRAMIEEGRLDALEGEFKKAKDIRDALVRKGEERCKE